MKRLLAILFLLSFAGCVLADDSAHVVVNLKDFRQVAYSRQPVTLTPMQPVARTYGTNLVNPTPVTLTTSTNGVATFSNTWWGYYKLTTLTAGWNILLGTNQSGLVQAAALVTNVAALPPSPQSNYYTMSQVDAIVGAINVAGGSATNAPWTVPGANTSTRTNGYTVAVDVTGTLTNNTTGKATTAGTADTANAVSANVSNGLNNAASTIALAVVSTNSGSGSTTTNAADLTTGTLDDGRLSANVLKKTNDFLEWYPVFTEAFADNTYPWRQSLTFSPTNNFSYRLSAGFRQIITDSTNNFNELSSGYDYIRHDGTGVLTNGIANKAVVSDQGPGNISVGTAFAATSQILSNGNIGNLYGFHAIHPTISGTGRLTNYFGLLVDAMTEPVGDIWGLYLAGTNRAYIGGALQVYDTAGIGSTFAGSVYATEFTQTSGGGYAWSLGPQLLRFDNAAQVSWGNGATYAGTHDIGIKRGAAGVLKVTDGWTGSGLGSLTASNGTFGNTLTASIVNATNAAGTNTFAGTVSATQFIGSGALLTDVQAGASTNVFYTIPTPSISVTTNTGNLTFAPYIAPGVSNAWQADASSIAVAVVSTNSGGTSGALTNNEARAVVFGNTVTGNLRGGTNYNEVAALANSFLYTNTFIIGDGGRNLTTNTPWPGAGNLADETNGLYAGQMNTFVGPGAGSAMTSGDGNTYFGYNAGRDSTVAAQNSFFGWNAGLENTSGYHDTYLGVGAGQAGVTNKFATIIGTDAGLSSKKLSWTTAVGSQSGGSASSEMSALLGYTSGAEMIGSTNNLMGVYAGQFLSGTRNQGMGYEALAHGTNEDAVAIGFRAAKTAVGSNIVAIGNSTLAVNLGDESIAIGKNALSSATHSAHDVAIGSRVMQSATTSSSYNVGVGDSALVNFTGAGTDNVGIGREALAGMVSGSQSVAVGSYAAHATTGNSLATSVGHQSLFYSTGIGNTALGWQAGVGLNGAGTYNTFLGYGATAQNGSVDNSTAIGNGATVTNDNEIVLGNASVLGTHLRGLVMGNSNATFSGTISGDALNIGLGTLNAGQGNFNGLYADGLLEANNGIQISGGGLSGKIESGAATNAAGSRVAYLSDVAGGSATNAYATIPGQNTTITTNDTDKTYSVHITGTLTNTVVNAISNQLGTLNVAGNLSASSLSVTGNTSVGTITAPHIAGLADGITNANGGALADVILLAAKQTTNAALNAAINLTSNWWIGKFTGLGSGLSNVTAIAMAGDATSIQETGDDLVFSTSDTFQFTGGNVFGGSFIGSFVGNGGDLTNLNPANITSGTFAGSNNFTGTVNLNSGLRTTNNPGNAGQILYSGGASAVPYWAAAPTGGGGGGGISNTIPVTLAFTADLTNVFLDTSAFTDGSLTATNHFILNLTNASPAGFALGAMRYVWIARDGNGLWQGYITNTALMSIGQDITGITIGPSVSSGCWLAFKWNGTKWGLVGNSSGF